MAPNSPHAIGRYRVLAELGQGGTANVFLAVASGLEGFNKLVVLKRMKPQLASEPGFANMFLDEARLAARLAHPNIVQTYEVLNDNDLPVLVMEYLEGQTLANIVARSGEQTGFGLHHHLAIVSEALTGLQYSHELRDFDDVPLHVVHRDMTPHNVFVTFDGQVKILDFGIAKLSGSLVETESGVIKGKLRYIPPEQIVNEGVDRRADVYAVGVMLWEAATRDKLWRGLSDATIMNRVINGEIPRPSELRPDVDPALERIVMKALSPEREARHESARALQLELDAFRATLPRSAGPRELGPRIDSLFRKERDAQRRTIEAHLGAERLTQAAEAKPQDDATPANYAVSERQTRAPARKSRLPLVAVALALLGGLAMLVFGSGAARDVPPVPSAVTTRPELPRDGNVEVRISAAPTDALIYLDGSLLQGNPVVLETRRDDELHEVRATADGHDEAIASVRFDRNRDLVLRLARHSAATAPSTSAEASPAAAEPSRSAPARPRRPRQPDCDPPFTIDPRGIKRFKPHCVQ